MQVSAPNTSWLILADTRCSDKLRELSQAQHWPVVEYTNDHRAARSVVAMGAEYVAIEACRVTEKLPGLARILAALDTTEYVVCIATRPTPHMERDAASCGVLLCDSVERFAEYLGLLHPLQLPEPLAVTPTPLPASDCIARN